MITQIPACGYDSTVSITGISNTVMTGSVTAKTTVNLATYTANNSLAGTYNFAVTGALSGYPYTALSTAAFSVNISVKACVVTSYALTGCPSLADYTVLASARTDSCVMITQVPACGYDSTVSITGIPNTVMTGSVTAKTTVSLATYTANDSLVGIYNFAVTGTLSGYPYPALSTAAFPVNISVKACVVTSYALTGCPSLADYTVLAPARTDSCVMITQVPACGYDSTVSITGIPNTVMTGSVTAKTTVNLAT
jgi:hypothetical protein